jgi:hypothetical protein
MFVMMFQGLVRFSGTLAVDGIKVLFEGCLDTLELQHEKFWSLIQEFLEKSRTGSSVQASLTPEIRTAIRSGTVGIVLMEDEPLQTILAPDELRENRPVHRIVTLQAKGMSLHIQHHISSEPGKYSADFWVDPKLMPLMEMAGRLLSNTSEKEDAPVGLH